MFGPREVLLTSDEPVVEQFLNGRRLGPIGMSEEKDSAQMAREQADADAGHSDGSGDDDVRGIVPQIEPTPGMPERKGVRRRKDRVMKILHTLPRAAQEGIIASLTAEDRRRYGMGEPVPAMTGASRGRAPQPQDQRQPGSRPSPRPGPVPDQHAGQLPVDRVAQLPGSGWQQSDPRRRPPNDPGQGRP